MIVVGGGGRGDVGVCRRVGGMVVSDGIGVVVVSHGCRGGGRVGCVSGGGGNGGGRRAFAPPTIAFPYFGGFAGGDDG